MFKIFPMTTASNTYNSGSYSDPLWTSLTAHSNKNASSNFLSPVVAAQTSGSHCVDSSAEFLMTETNQALIERVNGLMQDTRLHQYGIEPMFSKGDCLYAKSSLTQELDQTFGDLQQEIRDNKY